MKLSRLDSLPRHQCSVLAMMSPFRNLTDFNLAVAVLSRLPAFLPGRNDRLAHFLTHSLTDKSVTITPYQIAPFEQGVRALDPDLLSVRNPYDTAVKRKLDAHAGAYPAFALPHFVLIPPASQVHYNDFPRCTSCSKVLLMMVASVQGNPADGLQAGMARVYMQQYGTQGSFRAVQLQCRCKSPTCSRHHEKICPNRIEYLGQDGNPIRRRYLPESPHTKSQILTRHFVGKSTKYFTVQGKTYSAKETLYREGPQYDRTLKRWVSQSPQDNFFPALLCTAMRSGLEVHTNDKGTDE